MTDQNLEELDKVMPTPLADQLWQNFLVQTERTDIPEDDEWLQLCKRNFFSSLYVIVRHLEVALEVENGYPLPTLLGMLHKQATTALTKLFLTDFAAGRVPEEGEE